MEQPRIFITGTGIISPLGRGRKETTEALLNNLSRVRPLSLFPTPLNNPLPVGEIAADIPENGVPRTHMLALMACQDALAGTDTIPEALIIGTTTGGMTTTEKFLRTQEKELELYQYHATGSVTEFLAEKLGCTGPVITITTACSSGTAAMKIALEYLRSGRAKKVLAGGVDSLCWLTYYGFNSLQLIDPLGARPLDRDRHGMSVGEGSAMLLLEASAEKPENAIAEILGAGLSCDAYHPAAPHPEGKGALQSMRSALDDAGIKTADIEYINLHGTGTVDNDLAEATAIRTLFSDAIPLISSIKGALGHSLAASGAIEAVICSYAIADGFIPANTGCKVPDPELKVIPVLEPVEKKCNIVLSNSFGFGGNNASIILGDPGLPGKAKKREKKGLRLEIFGSSCITGAGTTGGTMESFLQGKSCKGRISIADIPLDLPQREIRRLKRLPRIALSLAMDAVAKSGLDDKPSSIFYGTCWGPQDETYDFLKKLFETNEQFSSPTDFVGSVHNAPAGHIAIHYGSTGPNITTTGKDYSFEQALMVASLIADEPDTTILVIGTDESHAELSDLFDKSVRMADVASDGGGAICIRTRESAGGMGIHPLFFRNKNSESAIESLASDLGGPDAIQDKYGAILAGIPLGVKDAGTGQLKEFTRIAGTGIPVIEYRKFIGEFTSASAVAAILSVELLKRGNIPAAVTGGKEIDLQGKGILIVGFGQMITAMEIVKS